MQGLKAEPSTATSASLEPSDESKLQITVRDGEGGQMTFRVKKSTKMKKLMTNYCEKQGVAYGTYRFTLDGKRINESDTAETLQMEDGDCIDAFLYQQGGSRE